MKKVHTIALLTTMLSLPAMANTKCDDVSWHQDVLAKYPSIANACQAVVEKDGQEFVKLNAEFIRYHEPHKVQLAFFERDGTKERQTIAVKHDAKVDAGGNKVGWDALPKGYKLEFYIPSDRFEVHEVVNVTPPPHLTQTAALPKTASWLPALGALGMTLIGVGGFISRRYRRQ
ncbi:LPXTG cell wall anchor domain-containing protein [Shewanella maritima]|uniref:LPXTG cell wall anchor domain-containing protein n=1 Tax=Shewanella maritima TaxID=2520507 RepID=A0A411PGA0_9GAMM|nr:LPXTG cell wall anchor domain-containing protein [Shewanella maritima]QBF82626.1 LPXTG cell wall anchor domain-containing protein [Shewanella maritima]